MNKAGRILLLSAIDIKTQKERAPATKTKMILPYVSPTTFSGAEK
jgi:hypothetical protein